MSRKPTDLLVDTEPTDEVKADDFPLSDYALCPTSRLAHLAACNLNQWALDFDGNLARIIESVKIAKSRGAKLRLGSELEIPGYGCEDHFLEPETITHSWESLAQLLRSGVTEGILCAFGLPLMHGSAAYNCCAWVADNRIILLRPKASMSDEDNYSETRYFTSWVKDTLEEHVLPACITRVNGQRSVPIGKAIIQCNDARVANETCEEMFIAQRHMIEYALNGVDVVCNMSGSLHQARKLDRRVSLIVDGSKTCGGVYLYSNQQGCDGGRVYYDGCAMIAANGDLLAQASQFSVRDVEVVDAIADLTMVEESRRARPSFTFQAASAKVPPIVKVDFNLAVDPSDLSTMSRATKSLSQPIAPRYHRFEEEAAYSPACWLWDYLRRTRGCAGFFLPLSGGADSASTATIVYVMCDLVVKAIEGGNKTVLEDLRRITHTGEEYTPSDPKEVCSRMFHTCYMGTEAASSKDTRRRSKTLAESIGAFHYDCNIDTIVDAMIKLFGAITGKVPKFRSAGGSKAEILALQNIQGRLRMVLSYFLAQLIPFVRGSEGFLLVLGSANVDEALRGYYTKYDCSSADINPIGGICKGDLRALLKFAGEKYDIPVLTEIGGAPPTAELEPLTHTYVQTDEADMSMTYEELDIYGYLRKACRCGPVAMYEKLVAKWTHLSASVVAEKVKNFYRFYANNRHKMSTLTPSLHFQHYSADDNRYDHRPILYPSLSRQFAVIDALAARDDGRIESLKSESS